MEDIYNDYVHLVRLALEGQRQDVVALARKSIGRFKRHRPELVETLRKVIAENDKGMKAVKRDTNLPLPVDIDTRLELVRKEFVILDYDPVWPDTVTDELEAIIEERKYEQSLLNNNLSPTRSVLFVGPPGVGKTLAARWLSYQLNRPILTLDLAAVMSSFLGRTGNNIKAVLDYAHKNETVLLLDEFDAIAKRRTDDSEVGELKRLVNVLLQAVDNWPSRGLLIAATNHPDLLDPAVWRRFERVIQFPFPSHNEISYAIKSLLLTADYDNVKQIVNILATLFEGASYADIERRVNLTRKESIVRGITLEDALENLAISMCKNVDKNKKMSLSKELLSLGVSQRKTSVITGISRDTIRKHAKDL